MNYKSSTLAVRLVGLLSLMVALPACRLQPSSENSSRKPAEASDSTETVKAAKETIQVNEELPAGKKSAFDSDELLQLCANSLVAARQRSTEVPQQQAALVAAQRGDAKAIADALGQLEDDPDVLFAVQHAQLLWLKHGHNLADLAPLHELIRARINPEGFSLLSDIGSEWFNVWVDRVGVYLDAGLLRTYGVDYPELALHRAVVTLCAQDQPEKALPLAKAIGKWQKEDRAEALALVATKLDSPQRKEVLELALAAPGGALIEEGGEEAAAYAKIAQVLADSGAKGTNTAVKQTYSELGKVLSRYFRGVDYLAFEAGAIAARQAQESSDPTWLAYAADLKKKISDEQATWRLEMAIAQAEHALGKTEQARRRMTSLPDEAFSGPRLAAHLRETLLTTPNDFVGQYAPLDDPLLHELPLVISKTGGAELLDKAFETMSAAKASKSDAVSLRALKTDIVAMMVAFDRPERKEYADELDAEDIGEAMEKSVTIAARLNDEASLARALGELKPEHIDVYHLPEIIEHLDVAFLRDLETVFHKGKSYNRTEGLLTLASHHIQQDRWADANRCVEQALLAEPPKDDGPWEPWIRRREAPAPEITLERGEPLDIPFPKALSAAVEVPDEDGQRLKALHDLAQRVADHSEHVKTVVDYMEAAAPEEEFDPEDTSLLAIKMCRIAHAWLLADEIDNALEVAVEIPDCRYVGWGGGRIAELATEWFDKHPDRFQSTHANQLMQTLGNLHPQDLGSPLFTVVVPMLVRLPPDKRRIQTQNVIEEFGARFPRNSADTSVCSAAVGLAEAKLGNARAAQSAFAEASKLLNGKSWYGAQGKVIHAIIKASKHVELPRRKEHIQTALRNTLHNSRPLPYWEEAMLQLFAAGDQETIPELIAEGDLRSDLVADFRRSWWAEAPEHAPRPVGAMLAMFDESPRDIFQAIEQVLAVARALEKEGRKQLATKIRVLIEDRTGG